MNLLVSAIALLAALRFLVVSQRNANLGRMERALAYGVVAVVLGLTGAGFAWWAL